MKKLSSPFARLLAVAGCALALGSCNRAEYAMLPKTSTYYGEAAHRHVAAASAASEQPAVVAAAPIAAPAPAVEAPAAVVAAAPRAVAPKALATPSAAAATTAVVAPKPTLVQHMVANKAMKSVNKMMAKLQGKQAMANTARLDGNLRTGIIALLIAVIATLFTGISGGVGTIFGVIAIVAAIIGLVFLVLWLLDNI